MQIYVSTFAKYNNGSSEGRWLTLGDYINLDDFLEAYRELHSDEKDPELMFQDWEGIPERSIGEVFVDEHLWELAELEEREQEIVVAYMEVANVDLEYALEHALDNYIGYYYSVEDYAEDYVQEIDFHETISNHLWRYIDFKQLGEDLLHDRFYQDGHLFYAY